MAESCINIVRRLINRHVIIVINWEEFRGNTGQRAHGTRVTPVGRHHEVRHR